MWVSEAGRGFDRCPGDRNGTTASVSKGEPLPHLSAIGPAHLSLTFNISMYIFSYKQLNQTFLSITFGKNDGKVGVFSNVLACLISSQ